MTTKTANAIERSSANTVPSAPKGQSQLTTAESTRSRWYYRPEADIFESGEEFTIVLDMPGVASGNVEITCEDRSLTVHGRVNMPAWAAGSRAIRTEYGVGDYFRRFDLDDTIDVDRIHADCPGNGVVTIHLPKVEAARPIKIAVKSSR